MFCCQHPKINFLILSAHLKKNQPCFFSFFIQKLPNYSMPLLKELDHSIFTTCAISYTITMLTKMYSLNHILLIVLMVCCHDGARLLEGKCDRGVSEGFQGFAVQWRNWPSENGRTVSRALRGPLKACKHGSLFGVDAGAKRMKVSGSKAFGWHSSVPDEPSWVSLISQWKAGATTLNGWKQSDLSCFRWRFFFFLFSP